MYPREEEFDLAPRECAPKGYADMRKRRRRHVSTPRKPHASKPQKRHAAEPKKRRASKPKRRRVSDPKQWLELRKRRGLGP